MSMALAVPKLLAALLEDLNEPHQQALRLGGRSASDAQCSSPETAMLISDVRPGTLAGIKRLASQLRKQQGIKHSDALDQAARAAGRENFRHALRSLPRSGNGSQKPYILLTIYWSDKDRGHQCGRETLRIDLSKSILEICTKPLLKHVRGFGDLRMVAKDHFVCDSIAPSQEYARGRLCTAERSIRFIEGTGVLPSRDPRKLEARSSSGEKLPGRDHSSIWVDPANGQHFFIDEPYGSAALEAERSSWATQSGWRVLKTLWPGMYRPYDCDLYVAVDNRDNHDIDSLVRKINSLGDPLVSENWSGESCPSWDTFFSPWATTEQDKRRARCKGMIYPVASSKTVPYSFARGTSKRRPDGKLGIEGHIQAGRIIKATIGSEFAPAGVDARMSSLRFDLEDWLGLEIGPGQLEGPEFFEVYYRGTDEDKAFQNNLRSQDDVIAALRVLKGKLEDAYPECAPRRLQLRRIEVAISMIRKAQPG